MKYQYIAIEREYGSGGREVAELIGQKTGVPCYGRQILERVAETMHVTPDQIEDCEEKATGSMLYSLYAMSQVGTSTADMLPLEGKIYLAEQEIIREMASCGSAVFLGHCAVEALRGRKGVLRVFIRANEESKMARIRDAYGIEEKDIRKVMREFDRKRANYYNANTSRKWREAENYDIILDSGTLGTEQCAQILMQLLSAASREKGSGQKAETVL